MVVHAAAGMQGAAADRYRSTVVGTRNLFDALRGSSVRRVVLISSVAVYRTCDLAAGATVDETTPVEPEPGRRGALRPGQGRPGGGGAGPVRPSRASTS